MKRLLVLVAACGQGGGARVSGDLDQAKLENVQLAFVDKDKVRVDMTILVGKDKQPMQRFVNANIGPNVELELRAGASDESDLLCKAGYHISNKELDPKTGKVSSVTQFQGVDHLYCVEELLKKNYQDKPYVLMKLSENGKVLRHAQQLAAFTVPDNRPAKLPELDAEIAKLGEQIAAVDPALAVPPCTPALAGTARLDGVDQLHFRKPPPGSDEAWPWLRSPLFYAIESYGKREYENPGELLERMTKARKVLVFVADKHMLPNQVDDKTFTPGIFEGFIYVLDRDAGKQVCVVPLTITSSESIKYTATIAKDSAGERVTGRSDAEKRLRLDFLANVEAAIAGALDKAGIGAVKPRLSGIEVEKE